MRELGQGRWDKILMRKMTDLSEADNYSEAKEEWVATGEVWWRGNGTTPDWVAESHQNHCLCGHTIVYHFQVVNTVNGLSEIVGSDHINSYMIMRQIAQERNVEVGTITDEEVERWLKQKVGSMKAEAWWKENGERFEKMFDKVKEVDIWKHSKVVDWRYSTKYAVSIPVKKLIKKAKGTFGTDSHEMASIVWRWNHPDNPKNQQTTRGYPNDNLMADLYLYSLTCDGDIAELEEEKTLRRTQEQAVIDRRIRAEEHRRERRELLAERERIRKEEWEAGREERERREKERLLVQQEQRAERARALKSANIEQMKFMNDGFVNLCGYYGIPAYTDFGFDDADFNTLSRIKGVLMEGKHGLDASALSSLRVIFQKKATEKQQNQLKKLGFTKTLTVEEAYYQIKHLEEQQ